MTVRSDGVVENSSAGSASEPFGPGGRLPANIVELLPSDGEAEPHVHEVEVGGERWRCAVHPVPIGPTVLLVRRVVDEPREAAPLVDLGLTPRQAEVALALARSGGTNSQLARELQISEGTVKKHLETVYRVLMVDSRAAAVAALRSIAT
jgi:DNA-binding CsgD family transcriptional regulator